MKKQISNAAQAAAMFEMGGFHFIFFNVLMLIMTTIIYHVVVVLRTPEGQADRAFFARSIYDSMLNNSWFATPDPALADFLAKIVAYQNALSAALEGGGKDETAAVKVAWTNLNKYLKLLKGYVQKICLDDPENAEVIALSAGMDVRRPVGRKPQEFNVKALADGNGVTLIGKIRQKNCLHEFQLTTTPSDDKSWRDFPITVSKKSTRTITGLEKEKRIYFRHRCIVNDVPLEWDPVISIILY